MNHAEDFLYMFTIEQANKMLPLVRTIVQDIVENYTAMDKDLQTYQLMKGVVDPRPTREQTLELRRLDATVERLRKRVDEAVFELFTLGVEMKDYELGIVDFPAQLGDDTVYLTWQLGEEEVRHWHALESSYMDRHEIATDDTAVRGG